MAYNAEAERVTQQGAVEGAGATNYPYPYPSNQNTTNPNEQRGGSTASNSNTPVQGSKELNNTNTAGGTARQTTTGNNK